MVLISEWFDTVAVIAIIKLFICRVLPWIYRNTFGPMLFGSKIQLSEYDRWAGNVLRISSFCIEHFETYGFCKTK